MTINHYDVAIIGVGAVGSAALYQLSQKNLKILAIDSFAPPHNLGSSGGESRIVRQAIGEGEQYVPLALRSYEIWSEIEKKIGYQFLHLVGGLVLCPTHRDHLESNDFFTTTVQSAQKYNIKHEILESKEIKNRFPEFKIAENTIGYYENNAGFIIPEKCIAAQIELSKRKDVDLKFNESVTQITNEAPENIQIKTNKSEYFASKVILTAGSWINNFTSPEVGKLFKIYRQVLYWFEVKDKAYFSPDRFPVFIWKFSSELGESIYGFPAIHGASGGVKIATHNVHTPTSPDLIDRNVTDQEKEDFYKKFIAPYFPHLGPRSLKASVCSYTVTPDEDFIIDFAPGSRDILLVSACSGHGFKHSAAGGEMASNCILGETTLEDLIYFSLQRFN